MRTYEGRSDNLVDQKSSGNCAVMHVFFRRAMLFPWVNYNYNLFLSSTHTKMNLIQEVLPLYCQPLLEKVTLNKT